MGPKGDIAPSFVDPDTWPFGDVRHLFFVNCRTAEIFALFPPDPKRLLDYEPVGEHGRIQRILCLPPDEKK